MIDKLYLDYGKILHGGFNAIVAFLFMYQGSLGWMIRKQRRAADKRNFAIIKRHRATGPVLSWLAMAGYGAGGLLTFVDKGHLFAHPVHMIVGSFLIICILTTFIISRRIRGPESPWRTVHFVIGICILLLYAVQIFIGLNILL